MRSVLMSRATRALAAVAVSASALVLVGAPAAHAITVTPTCDAFAIDDNGAPTPPPLATGSALPPLNIPGLGASGARVKTGATFTVTAASTKVSLPASATVMVGGNPVTVGVVEVKNIILHFSITGAAAVSAPTHTGGTVIGATATATKTSLTLTLPGSKNGSTIPAGSAFFPGGSTFTTPSITTKVTAPNTPGTITTSLTGLDILVATSLIPAALTCTVPANTLGSVGVVAPGAPNAIDDAASTTPGTPVTINVLANDGPNDNGQAPDPSTLSIITNSAHGTTALTANNEVTYTPAAGFTGTDTFRYQVCVAVPNATTSTTAAPTTTTVEQPAVRSHAVAAGTTLRCDPATVTVTVASEVVQAVTTTTVATLPRTGSSSTPLALLGGGLCVLGLAALGLARRRTQPAR